MLTAYCEETKSVISAQGLRRLIAKNDLKDYKVFCPDCRIRLVGVNVTGERRIKVIPHFKRFPHTEHLESCKHKLEEKERELDPGVSKFIIKKEYEREESAKNKDKNEDEDTGLGSDKERDYTYYIDDIVDAYLTGSSGDLTISSQGRLVKREYPKWFKKVRFFKDGKDFIYYGTCRIGIYDEKYAVWFKDYVIENGEFIRLSAFIDKNAVKKYKYKNDWIDNIKNVLGTDKDVVCYFMALEDPELKTFNGKRGAFKKYDFKIKKLNLITFRHIA